MFDNYVRKNKICSYLERQLTLYTHLSKSRHSSWTKFLKKIFSLEFLDKYTFNPNTPYLLRGIFFNLKYYLYIVTTPNFIENYNPALCGILNREVLFKDMDAGSGRSIPRTNQRSLEYFYKSIIFLENKVKKPVLIFKGLQNSRKFRKITN